MSVWLGGWVSVQGPPRGRARSPLPKSHPRASHSYSYILLFSHLRPVLVSKGIKFAFVTCHTSLSEVKVFIKAFAFWLRSIGDADGLSPLPGTLYLDPERKAYSFFGIGMKMSIVRGLKDVLSSKFRSAFGLLKPRSGGTPSVTSSDSGATAQPKGNVLSRIIFGIGLRLPELSDNANDDTLFQVGGWVCWWEEAHDGEADSPLPNSPRAHVLTISSCASACHKRHPPPPPCILP